MKLSKAKWGWIPFAIEPALPLHYVEHSIWEWILLKKEGRRRFCIQKTGWETLHQSKAAICKQIKNIVLNGAGFIRMKIHFRFFHSNHIRSQKRKEKEEMSVCACVWVLVNSFLALSLCIALACWFYCWCCLGFNVFLFKNNKDPNPLQLYWKIQIKQPLKWWRKKSTTTTLNENWILCVVFFLSAVLSLQQLSQCETENGTQITDEENISLFL